MKQGDSIGGAVDADAIVDASSTTTAGECGDGVGSRSPQSQQQQTSLMRKAFTRAPLGALYNADRFVDLVEDTTPCVLLSDSRSEGDSGLVVSASESRTCAILWRDESPVVDECVVGAFGKRFDELLRVPFDQKVRSVRKLKIIGLGA